MYLALALFLLAFGIPQAVWPYRLARFEERLDSIGSKRARGPRSNPRSGR